MKYCRKPPNCIHFKNQLTRVLQNDVIWHGVIEMFFSARMLKTNMLTLSESIQSTIYIFHFMLLYIRSAISTQKNRQMI